MCLSRHCCLFVICLFFLPYHVFLYNANSSGGGKVVVPPQIFLRFDAFSSCTVSALMRPPSELHPKLNPTVQRSCVFGRDEKDVFT